MKIGICLPTLEDPISGRAPSYLDLREMSLQAEADGFDSLWLFDHLIYRRSEGAPRQGVWESWTMAAALAEATRHIELGTLVTCVQFRNPALLAKMAASLDEISRGRFTLGIGAGWHEPEFNAFGFPFDHRAARFDEAVQIIQPLLKTGTVDFTGQYYRAVQCEVRPRGPSGNGVPLLIGATGPRMLELTARYADIWNAGYVSSMATLRDKMASITLACQAVGRDPATLAITVHLPVVFTDLTAPPSFLAEYATGTDTDLAQRLRDFAQAGVAHVMIECFPAGAPTLERLAKILEGTVLA